MGLPDGADGAARLVWTPCGDSALRVVATGGDAEDRWRLVHALATVADEAGGSSGLAGLEGLRSVAATYDSALVELDPVRTDHATVRAALAALDLAPAVARLADGTGRRVFELPVVYGAGAGVAGEDLDAVAAELGLPAHELVRRHVGLRHVVRCYSHAAAPMLDGPDLPGEVPRLASPRLRAPAGAVMLAGRQAMVLTREQPTGWRLVGWTPVVLVGGRGGAGADGAGGADGAEVVAYRPGDVLRYRRVDAAEAEDLRGTPVAACQVAGP